MALIVQLQDTLPRLRTWVMVTWVMVTAVGLSACKSSGAGSAKYETVPVTKGALTSKVTASGTLSALVTVLVGSQVSGRIEKLYVDYNSTVKKGALLAQIDPQLFQAGVDQQAANVAQGKAQVSSTQASEELARLNFERQTKLLALKLIGQADFDTAKANYDVAKAATQNARAGLQQQEAQLRLARANLNYARIVSPIDGVVISRSVDVGQTVASAFQAPTLFTIAQDLRKMQVDTSVAEADIGKLKPGGAASFTVDAYPGERFVGHIRQIRDAPQTVQNVVTYDVVIDVENPDLKLLPGMTANSEVIIDKRENVLQISNAAFRYHPPADADGAAIKHRPSGETAAGQIKDRHAPDKKNLWVLKDGAPKMVPVRIGITDGHLTEILEGGVGEGDAIITAVNDANKSSASAPAGMRRPF